MIITNLFLVLCLALLFPKLEAALISEPENTIISDSFTEEMSQDEKLSQKPLIKGNDLLSRVNEKLAGINILDEQQLKRLEALEYKLTRIEVTQQERSESLRSDLQELSRRIQGIEWMASKSESTLDQIRNEVEGVRTANEGIGKRKQEKNIQAAEVPLKLNELTSIANTLRVGLLHLEQKIIGLGKNVTLMMNVTRDIHQAQRSVPTKQFLNNALYGLKSQPVYITMQPQSYDFVSTDSDTDKSMPTSCSGLKKNSTELFKIRVPSPKFPQAFYVRCELVNNEPWMVIQNREDGSVNFLNTWMDYINGFGNLNGEFWIGLDKLYSITSNELQELLIILEDFDEVQKYAHYSAFAIAGEREHFALSVLGAYNGTAGDSLSYHAGYKFSTVDLDNDGWKEGNCAEAHQGAWWYNACDMSNLNGRYLGGAVQGDDEYGGIYWNDFRGSSYSLKSAKMLIRPVSK